MMRLWRHPLFLTGLVLRLVLLLAVVPDPVQQWYAPFLANSLQSFGIDPWSTHLASGGVLRAFPYGYATWLTFLPLTAAASWIGVSGALAYGITLLCVDIVLLMVLRRMSIASDTMLLGLYWLSPILVFATYWLGVNDILPVMLLMLGFAALKRDAVRAAAVWMALAASAKLSMVLALPIVFVYLFNNKRLRRLCWPFALTLGVVLVAVQGPYLMSDSARVMLFQNPEMAKVYDLALDFGNGLQVYLLPLVYLLAVFGAWRIGRMSFDLLTAFLGIVFFLVLLLTPASTGWFIWVLPFLVLYQVKSDRVTVWLVTIFSILYVGFAALVSPLPHLAVSGWPGGAPGASWLGVAVRPLSIWQTLLLGTGLIIAIRMIREGIQANEYFRLSRKPFVLGIAGDSASGKDTLADAVAGLFGRHSVVKLSGDDYHLWDRQRPMWQVLTHLNPRTSDLVRLAHDTQALVDGRTIWWRHYDHSTGTLLTSRELGSNDFIVVSGLHALHLPMQRGLYDLKVYLDIDESLRRHFKVERDMRERGQTREAVLETLDRREGDSRRYIRSQAEHADLVLSLQPIHGDLLQGGEAATPVRLKLHVRTIESAYYDQLVRVLIGVCGLHVDLADSERADGALDVTIEGDVEGADIALAAGELLPQLRELLDTSPAWQGGTIGLMQLVVLTHVAQALRARL